MYHSFPRRRVNEDEDDKALRIVDLIVKYGLLLTPEVTRWRDSKTEGPAEDYQVVARRCCFTELAPEELPRHAELFGHYALEFEHRQVCDLGAMPVMYIPRMSDYEDYGTGPAFDVLAGMVKAMASLIYPTERKQDPLLSYYQQREWQIIGGMLHDGYRVSLPVSSDQREALLNLDPDFFGRQLVLPRGRNLLVDECEAFLHKPTGGHILSTVRRVICPGANISEVKKILSAFPTLEVVALESIAS